MSHLKFLGPLAFVALAWWGCGTSDSPTDDDGPPPPPPTPCAAADVATCKVDQKACSMVDGAAACAACDAASYALADGTCGPIPGTAIAHDFATFTTDPGGESLGDCQS